MTLKPSAYAPVAVTIPVRRIAARAGTFPGVCLIALAVLAIAVQLRASWAAQLLLLPALLVLPGLLLLRALRVPGRAIALFPVYVPAASLVVLTGAALAVDLAGPLVGVAEPLRPEPMLAGLELACLVLLAAGAGAGSETAIPWPMVARPAGLGWPLLLPLVAVAGALRLNSGHGGAVALAALAVVVVTLVGAVALASGLERRFLSVVIYASALALMWSFSLRGDLVYGYDISAEYHAMTSTIQAGVWHAGHVGDAYGAMLSVTVLPADLHALAGMPGLLVFKVVYPAIGALLPVAIFNFATRFITRGWAFAATALAVAQLTFFQELPGLARQEIALVLFAAFVAAVLDGRISGRSRLTLVALLGVATTVSHYSTTYFAIVMFGLALLLQWVISWFRPVPRASATVVVAFLAATIGAVVWYGLITRSAANLAQFVASTREQGINLLPSTAGGGSLLTRYLQAGAPGSISPQEYAQHVYLYYVEHVHFVTPLADAASPRFTLRPPPPTGISAGWQAGLAVFSKAQLVIEQLLNLAAGIGALAIALRRRIPSAVRQAALLGLASVVILGLLRVSGTAASAYNPERAFLQAMVVLAIALGWIMQRLAATTWRRRAATLTLATVVTAVLLVNTTGLDGAAFGGGTATNLANRGGDYQQFDMGAGELAGARWLGQAVPRGQLIYADRYAQLRLAAMLSARPGVLSDITPLTLDQHAWVYASRTNVVSRTGLAFFDNQSATYAFPFPFLDQNYDVVFNDGTSEVFHR